jgi:hypothetical protein
MKFVLMLWLSMNGQSLTAPLELPGDYSTQESCETLAKKDVLPAVAKSIGEGEPFRYHWFCMPVHRALLVEGMR